MGFFNFNEFNVTFWQYSEITLPEADKFVAWLLFAWGVVVLVSFILWYIRYNLTFKLKDFKRFKRFEFFMSQHMYSQSKKRSQ